MWGHIFVTIKFLALPGMKRIFPIIIVLVSISLIGIIYIQFAWLNSMILLRQEQLREKIDNVTQSIANDFIQYKGGLHSTKTNPIFNNSDNFSSEFFKQYLVGDRLTTQEIYKKIRSTFDANNLDKVPFQFALAISTPGDAYMERQSEDFLDWYDDSVNHECMVYGLGPPPGTANENLAPDEILIILCPKVDKLVFRDMTSRIVAAILFTLIIVSAFYLTVSTMIRQKKLS